jgi:glycosyltransferase involved in cell wall biosynthesis
MKIAVIGAKGLPARQGGIEHYCAEVYPRLVAEGHQVDLFARSSYTEQSWFARSEYQGVQVLSLPSLNFRGLDAFFSSALGAVGSLGDYDVIHFHALGPALFSCLPRIASLTSAKIVVTCHGLDWQRAKWGQLSSRLIRTGEKTAVRFAHDLIVVSKDLQAYFHNTYGRHTVYIPTAPASYLDSDPDFNHGTSLGLEANRYLLFLGRLVPEKRPDLLIDAFQALKPQGWKLALVGGRSDTEDFAAQLAEKSMGNPDILFAGQLQGRQLAEIVRGAGLFVLPSDLEGLPLAMLEAMREGVPVLASDIPAHQQLVGRDRGVLFPAGNLEACIQAMNWAIQNPQALKGMATQAQRHVQLHHNWDHITEENLKIFTRGVVEPTRLKQPQQASYQLAGHPIQSPSRLVNALTRHLVAAGLLTPEQVSFALAEQRATGLRFDAILVDREWIKPQTIKYFVETVILPERSIPSELDRSESLAAEVALR